MDYGHPLQLGTRLRGGSITPEIAVSRALLSEQLGLDLVTYADHPDQPERLDVWTLLSWVGARTERVHLAATGLDVAVRPPAVVARAAASLDLLTGGRIALSLGAGLTSDAPRRSLAALGEAVDVVRGIWAAGEREPLHVDGTVHRVDGAQRGPAPAHRMPIWLPGSDPAMLRLVGRQADGWLTSLDEHTSDHPAPGHHALAGLRAAQAVIDQAATEAGRDPREIRRLVTVTGRFARTPGGFLVGPGDQWVEELLPLVLDEGVGTVLLADDDPHVIERFAAEVAPALREAVTRERASAGTVERTVPSIFVRSRRREGIDYDAVPASLAGTAVEPGDPAYASVRSTYLRGGSPGLVLRPRTSAEVVEALAFARTQPVPMALRSAGHGISGRSTNDGGIVLDLGALDTIEVLDEATRRVRIGPGARWGDVAAALAPYGWALSSGDHGGVGVGGLATAGGIGWFAREHGLTIDHLRAVDMVLADGSQVRASDTENPELFWAVRGAGANFGIVTAFELEADAVGDVGFAQLAFDASDTADFLERWGAWVESAPRDVTSFLIMGRPRARQPVVAQVLATVDSDDPQTVIDRLQPVAQIAPLLDQRVQILPYPAVVDLPQGPHDGQGEPVTRSALVEHLTPELARAAADLVASGAVHFFQIRSVGGAVADVAPDATAYAHRSANFSLIAFGSNRARLDALWDAMQPHFTGLYLSFETDPRPERLLDAYPPATLARLRALKSRIDPENVFRDNFNITPDPDLEPDPAAVPVA
ncbi:LLM class flavin-dependent oxidoreductase [Cellulomonas sp. P22]|uniref:LLM class flavin-dependent oxidoreductase n=1 Tax=Cellulomonas sp. P22 TaxID=3373189 RepID=UPI0037986E06